MNISNILLFEGDKCIFMLHHTYYKYPLYLYCIPTLLHIIHLIFLYMQHNKCMMLNSNFVRVWPTISQFHIFLHASLIWSECGLLCISTRILFCDWSHESDENLGNTREILFNGIITVNNFFFNFLSKKRKREKKTSPSLPKITEGLS